MVHSQAADHDRPGHSRQGQDTQKENAARQETAGRDAAGQDTGPAGRRETNACAPSLTGYGPGARTAPPVLPEHGPAPDSTPASPVHESAFTVRFCETGVSGCATPAAVASWMQEAAGHSATALGFGTELLHDSGLAWVVTRFCLWARRWPAAAERVVVRTWPAGPDRLGALRGYTLHDALGDVIAEATAQWVVFDLASRTMCGAPDALRRIYPVAPLPCRPFPGRALPRLREPREAKPVLVRKADLDLNGHVNNAHYMSWLFEPLDAARHPMTALRGLDIAYRMECLPGDTLTSCHGPGPKMSGPETAAPETSDMARTPADAAHSAETGKTRAVLHALRRDTDGAEVTRALTWWNTEADFVPEG